jgi:hypothetical protein
VDDRLPDMGRRPAARDAAPSLGGLRKRIPHEGTVDIVGPGTGSDQVRLHDRHAELAGMATTTGDAQALDMAARLRRSSA